MLFAVKISFFAQHTGWKGEISNMDFAQRNKKYNEYVNSKIPKTRSLESYIKIETTRE